MAGRHEFGVRIIYLTGSPEETANKGYRIWYSVAAPGETAPANPDDLRKSFFTKHKKDVIEFEFGDSGKTAYFAVQIENKGRKGPWFPRSFPREKNVTMDRLKQPAKTAPRKAV